MQREKRSAGAELIVQNTESMEAVVVEDPSEEVATEEAAVVDAPPPSPPPADPPVPETESAAAPPPSSAPPPAAVPVAPPPIVEAVEADSSASDARSPPAAALPAPSLSVTAPPPLPPKEEVDIAAEPLPPPTVPVAASPEPHAAPSEAPAAAPAEAPTAAASAEEAPAGSPSSGSSPSRGARRGPPGGSGGPPTPPAKKGVLASAKRLLSGSGSGGGGGRAASFTTPAVRPPPSPLTRASTHMDSQSHDMWLDAESTSPTRRDRSRRRPDVPRRQVQLVGGPEGGEDDPARAKPMTDKERKEWLAERRRKRDEARLRATHALPGARSHAHTATPAAASHTVTSPHCARAAQAHPFYNKGSALHDKNTEKNSDRDKPAAVGSVGTGFVYATDPPRVAQTPVPADHPSAAARNACGCLTRTRTRVCAVHMHRYALTCPLGKKYVGKTNRTLTQRTGNGAIEGCKLIREAIQKNGGIAVFRTEVLACCSVHHAAPHRATRAHDVCPWTPRHSGATPRTQRIPVRSARAPCARHSTLVAHSA